MPTLVQFGAGNIGRGFIGALFSAAGWEVLFVDVNTQVLQAINKRGAYRVWEVDSDQRVERLVQPVRALDGRDHQALASAIAKADLIATAVGLSALPHIAPGLSAGFAQRLHSQGGPLDVLVCENGVQACTILEQAVYQQAEPALREHLAENYGFVRTSIGRMVPAGDGSDPLDIVVEPYATLPVEAAAFRAPIPQIPGLQAKPDFDLVLRQKLYLHNASHACLAYAGLERGLTTVPDCMDCPDLVAALRQAGAEVSRALGLFHGHHAQQQQDIEAESLAFLEELLQRYRNRPLGDPLQRVARDPVRKLGPDDRLIGAARLCCSVGIAPRALAQFILAACAYVIHDDEPSAKEWRQCQAQGWRSLLHTFSHLNPEEALMTTLHLADCQRAAASRIRAAGIHLKDNEVADIEIAEFGLGRFEEIGLAIYVYVNTPRCCAKELAMLPGQICPEHLHPDVEGEAGKEETFRCRAGEVHLFLPGSESEQDRAFAQQLLPADKRDSVTVFRHVHLRPGDQCTLAPNTLHWFVAGSEGAVVSEFSTRSRDEADIFTDQEIQRVPDAE